LEALIEARIAAVLDAALSGSQVRVLVRPPNKEVLKFARIEAISDSMRAN
jgi:hypothetical protein